MFLHRIHLDPRCREARRDLSDPYQLHSTLCRAFAAPDRKCPEGMFLWRIEPEAAPTGHPCILLQSKMLPDWSCIDIKGWLAKADPAIDLNARLSLASIQNGRRFRFRLRANPCVTRNGKRKGLLKLEEQEEWIDRKGGQHGFSLPRSVSFDLSETPAKRVDVKVSQEQMLTGRKRDGNAISIFSVLYDGVLEVADPERFRAAVQDGIGHGKSMGLGLLSIAPITYTG